MIKNSLLLCVTHVKQTQLTLAEQDGLILYNTETKAVSAVSRTTETKNTDLK